MPPQPRRQPVPPAAQPSSPPRRSGTAAAAAAALGTTAAGGAAGAAAAAAAQAALGGVRAAAPSTGTVAAAVTTVVNAVAAMFQSRRASFIPAITAQAAALMPHAEPSRLRDLAGQEMQRELVFQRKALDRLRADLPAALGDPDPQARAAALARILDRERRFLGQRQQAAAQRMVSALEADLVRMSSPDGAYWELSPLVREHCVKCLAMAGKFWPWEVLDQPGMHLPQHVNCGCRLRGKDEAIRAGLMTEDDVPDTQDAVARAKQLMDEAGRLEETLAPEELEGVVAELEERRLQEGTFRNALRWAKGTENAGQFKPKAGGDPGAAIHHDLEKLRQLARAESPVAARRANRGRTVRIRGSEHHVPVADHWQTKIGGTTYQSPPGGTNLYRDGVLMAEDHPDLTGIPAPTAGTQQMVLPGAPVGAPVHTPQGSPIPDYSGVSLKLTKAAGGSNGAMWAKDEHGDPWLVKTYRGDRDRVATELLANAIYREMGAAVPEAGTWGAPGLPDFAQIPDAKISEPPLPKSKRISTGMVVREADGSLWVYEPKGHFGGYEHTFPKGGLEKGLTGQQNAHKELWEETGLHARVVGHVGDYQGDTGVSRYYLAVRTGGRPHAPDDTPYVPGGSETAAVKRLTPEQAKAALNRSRDQAILADVLAAGVPAEAADPGADVFPPAPDVPALTYQALPGEERKWSVPNRDLGEHYMTDALLANWDVVGLTQDNVLWNGDTPQRLDQGGTLEYRAQGQSKPFGPVPTEVWTLMSPKGGQAFGRMQVTPGMMRDQASQIGDTLTPGRIDQLVDAAPFQDAQMRERIRSALKDRVEWMREYAAGEHDLPQPVEGTSARQAMTRWQDQLDVPPEEFGALQGFVGDDALRSDVQHHLRARLPKDRASADVQQTVKRLDALLRATRTDDDMTVYRPLAQSPAGADELVGKTMRDDGYLTATTRYTEARQAPSVLQITVPSGARALYTNGVEGLEESVTDSGRETALDPDLEVLMPRGTRVQVTGTEDRGGRKIVHGTVVW